MANGILGALGFLGRNKRKKEKSVASPVDTFNEDTSYAQRMSGASIQSNASVASTTDAAPPTGNNSIGAPEAYRSFSQAQNAMTNVEKPQNDVSKTSADSPAQQAPALTSTDVPYDELMKRMYDDSSKAYELSRAGYKDNEARARRMNNAQLIADMANLGTQTWAASTQGAYKFPKIQSDDKYLQQAEAWRQQHTKSFIDEVTEKNKIQREIMLKKLQDEEQKKRYELMYGYRPEYYSRKAENEAEVAESVVNRNNAAAAESENRNANRDAATQSGIEYKDRMAGAAEVRASKSGGSSSNRSSQEKAEQDEQTRIDYANLPDEYKAHKTVKDEYGRDVTVVDDRASMETKRQKVTEYKEKNKSAGALNETSSDGTKKKSVQGIAGASENGEKSKKKTVGGIPTA